MGTFDEILAELNVAPDDRALLSGIAAKYPELQSGYLRQSDYSRLANEAQQKVADRERSAREAKAAADAAKAELDAWNEWKASNWDPGTNQFILDARVQELEQRLREAAAGGGSDVARFSDIAGELETYLQQRGVLVKDDILPLQEAFTNQGQAIQHMFLKAITLPTIYAQRTQGKEMDTASFWAYVNQDRERFANLRQSFEEWFKPQQAAMELEEKERKLQERESELAKKEQEAAARATAGPSPTDVEATGMGPLQQKLSGQNAGISDEEKARLETIKNARPGSGELARMAARELELKGTLVGN